MTTFRYADAIERIIARAMMDVAVSAQLDGRIPDGDKWEFPLGQAVDDILDIIAHPDDL